MYALQPTILHLTRSSLHRCLQRYGIIKRIALLYGVEKEARGRSPEERARLRQEKAKPVFDDLEAWLQAQFPRIPGKSELAVAIRYALTRMSKMRAYLDHGFLEADNNAGRLQYWGRLHD